MSDTNEEFEKWLEKQDMLLIPQCGFESLEGDLAFLAWQAATSASDTRYQARVRELEEALYNLLNDCINNDTGTLTSGYMKDAEKALSTTTPDTALQRKVLEARIDECHTLIATPIEIRVKELRAQLASLNRNETLGE